MQAPRFVRPLPAEAQAALEVGLPSDVGCTVRRGPMHLASAAGHTTTIARTLHCNEQMVRTAIHTFHARGRAARELGSARPHTDPTICAAARRAQRRALVHQRPRTVGTPTSIWTLE